MKKYYPYPSDRKTKKFYIITDDNKKIYYDNERVRQGLKVGYKARYRTRYFGDDDLFYDEFEFKNSYKHY